MTQSKLPDRPKSFRRRYAEMRARQLASGEQLTRADKLRAWKLVVLIMIPALLFGACCSWALVRMAYPGVGL